MEKLSDQNSLMLSDLIDSETEFIPLLSSEDEEAMNVEEVPEVLPILPLRNTVLFPGIIIPITVGREKSIKLIREAYKKDKIIGTVAQRNPNINEPTGKDIYRVGTVVGVNANIFGAGFPRNFIPSFSWGGSEGLATFALNKAYEVASMVMKRRGIILEDCDMQILRNIFEHTDKYRHF